MFTAMVSEIDCDAPSYYQQAPKLDSELAVDQLMALLVVEGSYKVPHIPCRGPRDDADRLPYGEWRRKICQWSFKVIDHFRLDREVVSCALNIFDRYLAKRTTSVDLGCCPCPCPSCQRNVDSRCFQLTAMTSLYLAMKLFSENSDEMVSPYRRLRLSSFVELSRGQFSAQDIVEMEQQILSTLQWKVHPPTPMTAVSYLLRLMPSPTLLHHSSRQSYDLVLHVLHELARYLTELSVCLGSSCSAYSPTQVAYSAILVSMDLLTQTALPYSVRNAFKESVANCSRSAGGTFLSHHDESIRSLQDRLRSSFWPEMLMDDNESADMGHPISMARDYGLLDIGCISNSHHYIAKHTTANTWEGSPVSVSRGAL